MKRRAFLKSLATAVALMPVADRLLMEAVRSPADLFVNGDSSADPNEFKGLMNLQYDESVISAAMGGPISWKDVNEAFDRILESTQPKLFYVTEECEAEMRRLIARCYLKAA